MSTSTTTFTDAWLAKVADAWQAGVPLFRVDSFKIGEGGWVMAGAAKVQRAPDPTLTDLDCIQNPSRYAADERYHYTKSIAAGKVVELSPTSVKVECILDVSQGNDDGFGNAPEFWEIGLYDTDGDMISHTTFYGQPKNDGVALRHYVTLSIARPS
jgi:hypothetical protein